MAEPLAGGDLPVRVPESGVGEIRTLARAFNTMAGSLGDARAELADSSARIILSADEARRIERDDHNPQPEGPGHHCGVELSIVSLRSRPTASSGRVVRS